jgi:hypothetical protein
MQSRLLSRSPFVAVRHLPGWRRSLAALWCDLADARRHALARRHRDDVAMDIDDKTLRDLGISRCELSSFRAEAEGRVERTRLRVFALHLAGS